MRQKNEKQALKDHQREERRYYGNDRAIREHQREERDELTISATRRIGSSSTRITNATATIITIRIVAVTAGTVTRTGDSFRRFCWKPRQVRLLQCSVALNL